MQDHIRYIGRIAAVRSGERFGYIGLPTITLADGSAHALETEQDVFIHEDECGFELSLDLEISFEVKADTSRGGHALRACAISQVRSSELMVIGTEHASAGTALADPRTLYVQPTPAQQGRMKPVDRDTLRNVLANQPMPTVPRDASYGGLDSAEIARHFLARIFPQLDTIGVESGGDLADESFDAIIHEAVEDHQSMDMTAQVDSITRQAGLYRNMRTVLRHEDNLLMPSSIIPIEYLPDLFMAVPVWYFMSDDHQGSPTDSAGHLEDKTVHKKIVSICDMIPNQRWVDTFLMFNRRMRTLKDYDGDVIPSNIRSRMKKMGHLFDHTVIMTPYHDVAGADWEDLDWQRNIDPYVVGFLKGIPLMFVIGRFSDSGTFPLHSELLADTIMFLRQNLERLKGFNRVGSAYWHTIGSDGRGRELLYSAGSHLMEHAQQLLAAFDRGELFPWLRGENPNQPVTT